MDTELRVRDESITLDGLHFHYRDWGNPDATPLVLLHAYTSHARSWDTVARAFGQPLPGAGRGPARPRRERVGRGLP